MTTPASNQNEPSKMKKLTSGNVDDSIRAKLPHGNGVTAPKPSASATIPPAPAPKAARLPRTKSSESPATLARFKFLPAFWTIASVLSMTVNIILIIALLVMFQIYKSVNALQAVQRLQSAQVLQEDPRAMLSDVLGGLHTNFVKMDQATISSTIPVDAVIPLNITVPVQATTRITLAERVTIPNAHVRINTGALNINADAVVTLPANTPLVVNLDFPLNVQNNIPIHLDVPVNIPLNQTQLHEPFVGLQKVIEPWYCLIKPDASVNGLQVCSPTSNPTPVETAIP